MNSDKYAPRVINIWARPNKWGYQFNVNHPAVKRLYTKYQQQHGLDVRIAMSDAQRHAFEHELLQRMREKSNTTGERDVQKLLDEILKHESTTSPPAPA